MEPHNHHALRVVTALGLLGLLLVPAFAGEQDEEGQEPDPIEVERSEQIVVIGNLPPADAATLDESTLESGRAPNLGLALRSIPGIDGVRRGQNAVEPVIRGLGWERVQTVLDGIPMYGACPARMDPPAASISSSFVEAVQVIKGIPSVSMGPAGTGGRITISTDYDRGTEESRELETWLGTTYDVARSGLASEVGVQGGTPRLDLRGGLEILNYDEYESASGVEVPAGQEEQGGFLTLGYRASPTQRWSAGVMARNAEDIDYPALPMNADELDDRVYRIGYRNEPETGRIKEISARVGFATVDHVMSNRGKPNRGMVEAETDSNADTTSARFATWLTLSPTLTLKVGGDYVDLDRDALRERRMVASGMTAYDHIWPDVRQDDTGLFAELVQASAGGVTLRAGMRLDRVSSEARGADDPSLQGLTIREQWEVFYGPAAARPDRDETLYSGNLQLEWDRSEALRWYAGIGQTTRAAGLTERFFAFAPAPGGYLVGNPTLDAETKYEVVLGGRLRYARVSGTASVFYHDFADYIYRYDAAMIDVNGDTVPDRVQGFANVDASLYGGELSLALEPAKRWSIPFSVSWVRAENDTDGRALPEIPPLEATLAARLALSGRLGGWVEIGGRFVDDQNRVDAEFPEDATPGFSVFHLRARVEAPRNIGIEIGVENLFDKDYHEHLTRETMLPVGDLAAGQEIPQPGRSAYVTTKVTF